MAWYLGSDNVIEVVELIDQQTGNEINDATVTATLIGPDGEAVEGAEDVPVAPTGDGGNYQGNLPNTLELKEDWNYTLETTIQHGNAKLVHRLKGLAAFYRG